MDQNRKPSGNRSKGCGKHTRSRRRKGIDGFILVNKPKGITSFDVIRKLRRILEIGKMGHLGTLDPNATGLLPICLGRATRLSQFLLHSDKRYRAVIRLGRSTTTYDADGEVVGEPTEPPEMTTEQLEKEVLERFIGVIQQQPPIFSAKKVSGKRLYEYAREGMVVEPKPCEVRINEIKVLKFERAELELEIASSSGMYVRSLANDIGQTIGCGAFLQDLIRLQVGTLSLENAETLERIGEMAANQDYSFIGPMGDILPGFTRIDINDSQVKRISNGGQITIINPLVSDGDMVRLFNSAGEMVAIGTVERPLGSMQTHVLPKVVFA